MNYIKKKIKGKKNVNLDDDDLDPDVFNVPQAPPGAPKDWIPYDERIDHDSEEWLAFKQLTQRVTHIVEESKQNLTKIVASTALDETTRTIKEVVTTQAVPNHVTKKKAAPARPPPPAATTKTTSTSQAICPTKDFDQDKRFEAFGDFDSFEFIRTESVPAAASSQNIDLDSDFGFGSSSLSVDLPVPELVLDVDNLNLGVDIAPGEPDPFDTSFVDSVEERREVNLLEDDSTALDKNLSNLLEDLFDDLGPVAEQDDPFVIKDIILAVFNMDPFDLFLQNASSTTTDDSSARPRSRSPNPFLMEDCGDDSTLSSGAAGQLHSSNPFAMASDDYDGAASGNDFHLDTVPNPFSDFQPSKPQHSGGSDLFELGFEDQPKSEVRKLSGDLFIGTKTMEAISSSIRRPSNPFCQPDEDEPVVGGSSFDPFESIHQAGDILDPFAGPPTSTSGWLTSPPGNSSTTTTTAQVLPANSHHHHHHPPPPPRPTKLPEEKPAQSVAMPPPRPPPPSRPAQPPARPPPPSLTKTVPDGPLETTWDAFCTTTTTITKPVEQPSNECRDMLEDFFGSPIAPVETTVGSGNGFDILLKEDKVEFEPIAFNVSITEATPTPKKNDINSFFDNDETDAGSQQIDSWPSQVKDLPRPPSIDMDVSDEQVSHPVTVEEEADDNNKWPTEQQPSLMDNFGFDMDGGVTSAAVDDVRMEATILEAVDVDKDKVQVTNFIDTSAFEEFEAKFSTMLMGQSQLEMEITSSYDPFSDLSTSAGAEGGGGDSVIEQGFGPTDDFDQLFGAKEIPAAPKPSPAHFDLESKADVAPKAVKPTTTAPMDSPDSDDSGPDFSVFIRPKMRDLTDLNSDSQSMTVPVLAPPPAKSPQQRSPTNQSRFNPFDKSGQISNQINLNEEVDEFLAIFDTPAPTSATTTTIKAEKSSEFMAVESSEVIPSGGIPGVDTSAEVESLGSPVFEADDTEPLEDFYPKYDGHGWDMMLRQPSKKKLTGQRYWKKIYLTLSDNGVLHLFGKREDKDAFQELPLQACYSLSEMATQQYDQYGKIFTVKLQYIFYRERVGVRPGQINKVTQGQITSLGQLAKLGLPLEHAPQVSQLLKLGSLNYDELKEFVRVVEDALFHLTVHRDRALTYKTEEIQVTVIDELRAEVANNGVVLQQVARVRVFFLAFIGNMPDVEIGLNDITKQGKEVVGRHDIIPVVTEEWIRLEKCQFHSCVVVEEFEKNRTLKLHPPDACFFELMRFRIRPPRNRELPLQVRTKMTIIGNRVEIRADVIVPGCISRKHGQIPCEDVAIRFPLPECWIYLFRTEKHFRYGSIKSAARRPGKIKGLDRFMGAGTTVEPSLIEVSTGQAKYEHQHRAIVWRVPKLPKEGQGAYSTYLFVCRMELSSYDQIPEEFDSTVYVEFYMPTTTASHTTIRSVSVTNPNSPEKYVKYLARHSYRVGIEHVNVVTESEYATAVATGGAGPNSSNASSGQTAAARSGVCSREPSDDNEASIPSN